MEKLNGVIKVGLGRSPSGKILDKNTHFYNFTLKQSAADQVKGLLNVLKENKEMFYSHKCRGYRPITAEWVQARCTELSNLSEDT